MKFPCEIVAKNVLPAFRAMLARKLVNEYGFTQIKVASILGVSQASINYYLTSKRGRRVEIMKNLRELKRVVENMAREIAEGRMTQARMFKEVCEVCDNLKFKGLLQAGGGNRSLF